MKDLIKALLKKWSCCHNWEHWKTVDIECGWGDTYGVYHFYCTKCGKFKKVKSH